MFDLEKYELKALIDHFSYNDSALNERMFSSVKKLSFYQYLYLIHEVLITNRKKWDLDLIINLFQVNFQKERLNETDFFIVSKFYKEREEHIYSSIESEIIYIHEFMKLQKLYNLKNLILINTHTWISNLMTYFYEEGIQNKIIDYEPKLYNKGIIKKNLSEILIDILNFNDSIFILNFEYSLALLISNSHVSLFKYFFISKFSAFTRVSDHPDLLKISPIMFSFTDWKLMIKRELKSKKTDHYYLREIIFESISQLRSELNSEYFYSSDKIRYGLLNQGRKFSFNKIESVKISEYLNFIESTNFEEIEYEKYSSSILQKFNIKKTTAKKVFLLFSDMFNEHIVKLTVSNRAYLYYFLHQMFNVEIKEFNKDLAIKEGVFNLHNKKGLLLVLQLFILLEINGFMSNWNNKSMSDKLIFLLKRGDINQRVGLSDRLRKLISEYKNRSVNQICRSIGLENNRLFVSKLS